MADGDELHGMIVHFSCEHSHFCGKTRAYLRFKQQAKSSETLRADLFGCTATVQFQDVLVTGGPSGLRAGLEQLTGSSAIPQIRLEDGQTYVQDTSAIIDTLEELHPVPAISPTPSAGPRQLLASYLLDLFADEWMLVWCYHSRWRSNMKTPIDAGVLQPGKCPPAREGPAGSIPTVPADFRLPSPRADHFATAVWLPGGTSCYSNRDYVALQFSHHHNSISPIHSVVEESGSEGRSGGAVNKAARIGPTLDFFDAETGYNCTAAADGQDIGLLLNHDALGIDNLTVGAWHDSYHRCEYLR